jgi:hypothetical protein
MGFVAQQTKRAKVGVARPEIRSSPYRIIIIIPGVNFLEKLPVSLKSCSKWVLQYSTPSMEE